MKLPQAASVFLLLLVHGLAVSNSKLSIHVNQEAVDATFISWLQATQPRLIKVLDPSSGVDRIIRAAAPNATLIGRIYSANQPMSGDPAQAAQAWYASVSSTIASLPGIDFWEGYNEPACSPVATMQWYAAFEVERVRLLATSGSKAAIGQFSTGTPDVTNPAIIQAFYPAIDAAIAAGGVLALHEYNSPNMSNCYSGTPESGSGWMTGRYRKLYNQFLLPTGRRIPLVVTENGVDNSPCGGSPNLGGWAAYCQFWAQNGYPGTCEATYMAQLAWYDAVMQADDYVVGSTIFCLGCDGFSSYDMAPMLPTLQQYMVDQ